MRQNNTQGAEIIGSGLLAQPAAAAVPFLDPVSLPQSID